MTLPPDSEFPPALTDFFEILGRPAEQAESARLKELGLNVDSDLERSLGRRIGEPLVDQRPWDAFGQRSDLNVARTSSERICGCSQAAKWPPSSTSLKWMSLG